MKRIKWINQYDTETSEEGRVYSLSSKNKMDYILSVLIKNGWDIEIISPAITNHDKGYYKRVRKNIGKNVELTSFCTFGAKTKLGIALNKVYSVIQLFNYLIFHVRKGESIIVSHSLIFTVPVYFAKKIRKFNLILDFGEEYNKVKKGNKIYQWAEPVLIKSTNKFIFGNDLMGNIYNVSSRNYIVAYGQYLNNMNITNIKRNKTDNKIHLVYAGIISQNEKSAFRAIELAKYLDDNYVIHILGKVDKGLEEYFHSCIKKANEYYGNKVIYEGIKAGDEYINQMLQYDIGLNLRAVDEEYIDFAFPSKILSYLNVGLRVVSSEIKCVRESEISSLLYYFDDNNSSCIAKVIKSIDLKKPYDSMNKLKEMDRKLGENLGLLILDDNT